MIIYFLLIGFASILVGVEFLADFHSGALKDAIWQNIKSSQLEPLNPDDIFAPIDRMRSKAILMVGIIMFVVIIVLMMFIKNITEPLQHMIKLSHKISSGDLSQTINIQANNELAELGNVINEMSSNLQEIILLSQRTCDGGRDFVRNTIERLDDGFVDRQAVSDVRQSLENFRSELNMLDEVIAYFNFYTLERKNNAG